MVVGILGVASWASGDCEARITDAETECKTDGAKDIRKNAEAGREAREAQGLAEEAKMLVEKL